MSKVFTISPEGRTYLHEVLDGLLNRMEGEQMLFATEYTIMVPQESSISDVKVWTNLQLQFEPAKGDERLSLDDFRGAL